MAGVLKIDGIRYYIRNNPIIQGITEFNTAVRQGSPALDDRNLASFVAFEDGRGGIGTITGDIREDLDKLADHEGLLAFKFQELIKPPDMKSETLTGATKGLSDFTKMLESDIDGTMRLFLGFSNQLWYSDGSGLAMTKVTDPLAGGVDITDMFLYTIPTTGVEVMLLGNDNDAVIETATDPVGGAFTAHGTQKGMTFVEYDGKVWAGGRGVLFHSIDPAGTWTVATPTGAWPNSWRFIGVFPFGQSDFKPYALINLNDPARTKLAVIDVDNNTVIPINLGISGLIDARPAHGEILLVANNGRDVYIYDPFNRRKRDLDFGAQERGGYLFHEGGLAISAAEHPRGPLVMVDHSSEGHIFLHKSTGWTPYGSHLVGAPVAGGMYVVHLNKIVYAVKPSGDDLDLFHVHWMDEAFKPGDIQTYDIETSDMQAITPWFDMGFSQLNGPMLTCHCGGWFDSNNKVKIEYQFLGGAALGGFPYTFPIQLPGWNILGTFPNTDIPAEPEITGRADPVAAEDVILFNSLEGIEHNEARFRITLITTPGNQPRQTPNAYPLIFQFLKRPDLRDSLRIEIDVERTLGEGDVVNVDEILTTLRAAYNKKTIPVIEYGDRTTYAFLTSLPRILTIGEAAPSVGDIDAGDPPTNAVVVLTMAEPL